MNANIKLIKNLFAGSDVYIIGSGWSLNYVNWSFFDDKITIGVNWMFKIYQNLSYCFLHHHNLAQPAIDAGQNIIVSEHDTCYFKQKKHDFKGDYFYYKHKEQSFARLVLYPDGEQPNDSLVTGGTTVIGALSFARHIGAKNIILAGVDGMSLGDMVYVHDYPVRPDYTKPEQHQHMKNVQKMICQYADHLKREGIGVMSLNPFTNFQNYEDFKK